MPQAQDVNVLWPAGPNFQPPVREATFTLMQNRVKRPGQRFAPSLQTPELILLDPPLFYNLFWLSPRVPKPSTRFHLVAEVSTFWIHFSLADVDCEHGYF